jgi:hypothetical protein
MRLFAAVSLFCLAILSSEAEARVRSTSHKLRGSADINASGILERRFPISVDMTMKRDGKAVELMFSFKGHACTVLGKTAGERIELDADQGCMIKFSEKGYDVELIAKLAEPQLSLAGGKATVSTRFSAEGTLAHDVKVLGFAERVTLPVAGGGKIELEEKADP